MFEDKNNGHTCYCENCLKLQAENEQLRQCLDEIEEIIKDSLDACYTCNSSDLCINCDKGNILKKIKQAKDGE